MRSKFWKWSAATLISAVFSSGAFGGAMLRADDAAPDSGAKAAEEAMKKAEQAVAEAQKQAEEAMAKARKQSEKAMAEVQKQAEKTHNEAMQQMKEHEEATRKRAEEVQMKVRDSIAKVSGGETGKYWLGVSCREASPELRAQLGLDDGQSIVIINVAPDSAAAKAGLKQHDVIVKINDTKLAHVADLSKVVNEADGKGVSLVIIRGGKEQTLGIMPEERSGSSSGSFQLVKPGMGMVMPNKMMQMQVHLPDNLSISVQRKGSEPAKITVKRGDDSWEITDKELDKLPADIRPHVEHMLGSGPMMLNVGAGGGGLGGGTGGGGGGFGGGGGRIIMDGDGWRIDGQDGNKFFKLFAPEAPEPQKVSPKDGTAASADVMKRLEQLDQRLQKMQEEMKQLREEPHK